MSYLGAHSRGEWFWRSFDSSLPMEPLTEASLLRGLGMEHLIAAREARELEAEEREALEQRSNVERWET